MTEAEWLACTNPSMMLKFLPDKVSDRKLRLFVCGYLRTLLRRYDHELIGTALDALETSERFADGLVTAEELKTCRTKTMIAAKAGNASAQLAADYGAFLNLDRAIEQVFGDLATYTDRRNEVQLGRDLWGPLAFHRLPVEPSWLTPNVVDPAGSIYADRAFDLLPVLANALEEAGCHDPDILGHCRGPAPHVRGCWVVDLLLGKE